MFGHLVRLILAAFCLATAAHAQNIQPGERDVVILTRQNLHFQHYNCPPVDPASPGGSPENPLEPYFFDQVWANAAYSDEPDLGGTPYEFECRWIRLSGFMTWDFLYSGRFFESAMKSYDPEAFSETYYFIENFAEGAPPRGDIARRQITIVARFYDLCAAGERVLAAERAAYVKKPNEAVLGGLGYPCHEIPAMMLSDARIETIHDMEPQYLLGEANRHVTGSLLVADPDMRKQLEPVVRAWAASVQRGVKSFTDEYLAQYPKWDDEDRREKRAEIESRDSYQTHLLRQPRFTQLNLASADIQIFEHVDSEYPFLGKPAGHQGFNSAVGCICLAESCADRWPLTSDDAETFLGDAACVALDDWDGRWRW